MKIDTVVTAVILALLGGHTLAQTPVRDTDASLTCSQISDEAAALSAGMGKDNQPGVFGRLGAVARSGAALLIPGAGLAMAGADLATSPGREREKADDTAARDRWNYLNGIYMGRNCNGRDQAASAEAVAQTVTPPTPRIQTQSVAF